jgi:hypothetical protein
MEKIIKGQFYIRRIKMKVIELIDYLKSCDQDKEVVIKLTKYSAIEKCDLEETDNVVILWQ